MTLRAQLSLGLPLTDRHCHGVILVCDRSPRVYDVGIVPDRRALRNSMDPRTIENLEATCALHPGCQAILADKHGRPAEPQGERMKARRAPDAKDDHPWYLLHTEPNCLVVTGCTRQDAPSTAMLRPKQARARHTLAQAQSISTPSGPTIASRSRQTTGRRPDIFKEHWDENGAVP